ncbi:carbohydrate-binding protein [Spirilliplanes yamanashiensis]|uniref:GH16 domain-containing protein n=1 Tax=Spirilliplanes yamanashiensis TaxID=42233 RepID=A0A8J3Y3K8_9ACTN|nr:carbohydrate-binding protein [Spirilliplanes yamanashiensis]MDP9814191.1 chitodextrinase [Spirilliplanes yamanashiensis]GIJ00827.1 hypothetical protein Sya03_01790 [Spirilliplanes yamanashiensis]
MKKRIVAALGTTAVAVTGAAVAVIPMTTSNAAAACAAAYSDAAVYTGGAVVSHRGRNWAAKWWTQHEVPSTGGSGVWRDNGVCGDGPTPPPTTAPITGPGANPPGGAGVLFTDRFDSFDRAVWQCEYTCPTTDDGKARFALRSGIAPDAVGTWTKARYKPARFTSGRFTVRFALTDRPAGKVWWGVALWDDGPTADMKQFNEINFGYTTSQSFTNTQLLFESAKRGKYQSIKVDTGVDLYDGQWHTATLEYDARRVAFHLDGRLLKTITDASVIPTDPMDLILGPRIVKDGGAPLNRGFTQSIDWVEIAR